MRILALIPARGGSKRLPGKNIRILGERPLIAWTIEPAIQSGLFCDVLVSTDDDSVAEISKYYGAFVPWLRPEELATDTATSVDVVLHAINWYEANKAPLDGVALLQPTSPFRTQKSLEESISLFIACNKRPVVSMMPAMSHPAWCFKLGQASITPFLGWDEASKRSQDLEAAYVTNGSIFIISPDTLKLNQSFLSDYSVPYIMADGIENVDIDTEGDWDYAAKCISLETLTLRKIGTKDIEFIFKLKSEKSAIEASGFDDAPNFEVIKSHYSNRITKSDKLDFIINNHNTAVGLVTASLSGNKVFDISIGISERQQGLGYGTTAIGCLIRHLKEHHKTVKTICSDVRVDNVKSQKIFIRNGFVKASNMAMMRATKSGQHLYSTWILDI